MKRQFSFIVFGLLIASIAMVGCQKKVTKVEPLPEPPKKVVIEEPKPVVKPDPVVDVFVPVDMDSTLRAVLQTIYFDFDKYDLRPDAVSTMEKIASFLNSHGTVRVLAEGHCDERGSSEYNMGLGENRSKAVKKYLTSYGIPADKVETTSFGKERPAAPNCSGDDNCNQKNRRVEWKVLAK